MIEQGAQTRTAFVLTGGGNRGAIQAGALLALFERGFRPDVIVGVSVGAINGSFLAFDPTEGGARRLVEVWRSLETSTLFGRGPEALRVVAALLLHWKSGYKPRGLRFLLETELPSRSFDDTVADLTVVATDLATGDARYLCNGDIIQAVLASAAAPLRFPPVTIDGEQLADGAIADPIPIEFTARKGVAKIVVVEPGRACDAKGVASSAYGVFTRSMEIITSRRVASHALSLPGIEVVHLALTCHADTAMTDLSRSGEFVESGYREARELLSGEDSIHWPVA